ncbi:MAG: DegT/DnrJ/EryC1/StrS family aminotransferase [Alphaproteobacteria bacterium]|nr:DegT/DnrJ/EryC1/StrS family aminotransferase [Alphaproteobacteria bacterium]
MNPVPFVDLKSQYAVIKDKVDAGIRRVLDHGQYIMGPEVAECEKRLAAFVGNKHCLSVSSGTDALVAPLMALGIGPGDAVFLPTFTFTATAEVVVLVGARPVYVDVHPRQFNIDIAHLRAEISAVKTAGRLRPRAVIAVDLFGLAADYAALNAICEAEGMILIADAAQSVGGAVNNKRIGSLAPITATSFFPAKPLGCYGDGGAVFLDDDAIMAKLVSIRVHGQGKSKYQVERIGLNARFDTIQAAVILAKLDVFEDELERRRAVAEKYTAALGRAVETPEIPPGYRSAWAQYTIQSDRRDAIAAALKDHSIPTAIYYPIPMHLQAAYRDFGGGEGSCPVSERLARRVLSLPMHPYLEDSSIARIAKIVCSAARD